MNQETIQKIKIVDTKWLKITYDYPVNTGKRLKKAWEELKQAFRDMIN